MQWDAVKRRGIQKVLQKVGLSEKSSSDQVFQQQYDSFQHLGTFLTTLRTSVKESGQTCDRLGQINKTLGGQVHSFLQAELAAGETEASSTGEIIDFLHGAGENPTVANQRVDQLQEAVGRFYNVTNDIGVTMVRAMLNNLGNNVLRPIQRDEDMNSMTKKMLEENEKLTLDYDSFKRAAQGASPQERDKQEAKMRAARDRLEAHTREVQEHLNERQQMRARLVVHSMVAVINEFHDYHKHASSLLQSLGELLPPLLASYVANPDDLNAPVRSHMSPPSQGSRDRNAPTNGNVNPSTGYSYNNTNTNTPNPNNDHPPARSRPSSSPPDRPSSPSMSSHNRRVDSV
eukprot:TRINITY_DN2071_c0_g1_i5.p1 TRINITY_DN2071_c0_g1~~TRINITY_DN2071_c0_g1_i5.p1  ORF type:complete len:345 (-),score=83.96 TRINITY_DN2071_c0_g1_i5:91-1125(-)